MIYAAEEEAATENTDSDRFDLSEAKLEKFILLLNDKKYNYIHEIKGKLNDVEIEPNNSELDERISKLETTYDKLLTLINYKKHNYIYDIRGKITELSFETTSENIEKRKSNMINKIDKLEDKINKCNYLHELKNME